MIKCQFEDGGTGCLRHVTVDVIIVNNNNEILLAKRAPTMLKEPGKWTIPGGFLDRDETITQAIIREAKEETGCVIRNLKPLRINSNPNRDGSDRQNVSFIFLAELAGNPGKFDCETAEIKWFSLDQIPNENEVAFDHHENIMIYKKYLNKKINIPVMNL